MHRPIQLRFANVDFRSRDEVEEKYFVNEPPGGELAPGFTKAAMHQQPTLTLVGTMLPKITRELSAMMVDVPNSYAERNHECTPDLLNQMRLKPSPADLYANRTYISCSYLAPIVPHGAALRLTAVQATHPRDHTEEQQARLDDTFFKQHTCGGRALYEEVCLTVNLPPNRPPSSEHLPDGVEALIQKVFPYMAVVDERYTDRSLAGPLHFVNEGFKSHIHRSSAFPHLYT